MTVTPNENTPEGQGSPPLPMVATEEREDEEDSAKNQIELYKLEYQKCADRYDNLYRSIWTQFSYMAAAAGVFLAFGRDQFAWPEAGYFIACIFLLFWYFAAFLPLNEYGDRVNKRLRELEKIFRHDYFNLTDPVEGETPGEPRRGILHFTDYGDKRKRLFSQLWQDEFPRLWRFELRVRFFVTWLAMFLCLAFLGLAVSLLLRTAGITESASSKAALLKIEIKAENGEDLRKIIEAARGRP